MVDFDYEAWCRTVNSTLAGIVEVFEERYRYPPDENVVRQAADGVPPDKAGVLPESLEALYAHVGEVSLCDVHVGYWIHPLTQTLDGLDDGTLPVEVRGSESFRIVTFGSDGGGSLFAVRNPEGAPVYYLPPAEIRDGVYDDRDSRMRVVAPTVPEFLERLRKIVECFAAQEYDSELFIS